MCNPVHLSCFNPLCQLYVPRLPGIPNEYPYLPDAFHLNFEDIWLVSLLGTAAVFELPFVLRLC